MNEDELREAMWEALTSAVVDFRANGVSVLGVRCGVSDEGIMRMTLDDVARICAKVASR